MLGKVNVELKKIWEERCEKEGKGWWGAPHGCITESKNRPQSGRNWKGDVKNEGGMLGRRREGGPPEVLGLGQTSGVKEEGPVGLIELSGLVEPGGRLWREKRLKRGGGQRLRPCIACRCVSYQSQPVLTFKGIGGRMQSEHYRAVNCSPKETNNSGSTENEEKKT